MQIRSEDCILCDDCHRKPLEIKTSDNSENWTEYVQQHFGYPFIYDEKNNVIRLQQPVDTIVSDTDFDLQVETTGCQEPQEAVHNALEALKEELRDLQVNRGYETKIKSMENQSFENSDRYSGL